MINRPLSWQKSSALFLGISFPAVWLTQHVPANLTKDVDIHFSGSNYSKKWKAWALIPYENFRGEGKCSPLLGSDPRYIGDSEISDVRFLDKFQADWDCCGAEHLPTISWTGIIGTRCKTPRYSRKDAVCPNQCSTVWASVMPIPYLDNVEKVERGFFLAGDAYENWETMLSVPTTLHWTDCTMAPKIRWNTGRCATKTPVSNDFIFTQRSQIHV